MPTGAVLGSDAAVALIGIAVAIAGAVKFRGTRGKAPDEYLGGVIILVGIIVTALALLGGAGGL